MADNGFATGAAECAAAQLAIGTVKKIIINFINYTDIPSSVFLNITQ